MRTNTASRTAQYMALFRAIESRNAKTKRLFYDPYASSFLDAGLKTVAAISSWPFMGSLIPQIIQNNTPGALSSGIARTRYIDDLLQRSVSTGIRQVIILGAGFDTRASRLPFVKNIPVIEIDHPHTAKLKIDTLKNSSGGLPGNVTYLQIDFDKQSLSDLLLSNNVDLTKTTTIIWEGVTNYLSADAINNTFAVFQKFAVDSYFIFTYIHEQVLQEPHIFYGAEKLLSDMKGLDERWTFGFLPEKLPAYLNQYGITLIEDLGAADYRNKYIPERTALLTGYEFYRVAFGKK